MFCKCLLLLVSLSMLQAQAQTLLYEAGSMQVSQVSWGRKNRLELYIDTERAAYGFEQERPDRLWVGGAAGATILERGSGFEAEAVMSFACLASAAASEVRGS